MAEQHPAPPRAATRTKYRCQGSCKSQAWGKPGMKLICGFCSVPFNEVAEQ